MTKVAPTKRKPILTFVRLLGALLLIAVAIPQARSAPVFAGEVCNNADLQGAYLYSVAEQLGPVAILGKITLDGRGNFAGTFNVSIDGAIITDAPLTGTYSIAADCTGSWTTVHPAETHHFSVVLVVASMGVSMQNSFLPTPAQLPQARSNPCLMTAKTSSRGFVYRVGQRIQPYRQCMRCSFSRSSLLRPWRHGAPCPRRRPSVFA